MFDAFIARVTVGLVEIYSVIATRFTRTSCCVSV